MDSHPHHLQDVFTTLRMDKLYANPSKCFFVLRAIFLGYEVLADGLRPVRIRLKLFKNGRPL